VELNVDLENGVKPPSSTTACTCGRSLCGSTEFLSIVSDALGLAEKLHWRYSEREGAVDYATSPGGLMVHSRSDWPCAGCRPNLISEGRGFCLCVKCAHGIISAAEAGSEGARALLDDVTDALLLLELPLATFQGPLN
jgi:hypothetical protein